MTKRTILAAGCLLLAAVPCSAQEKVVIGGSGALMNELPQLVQTYQARYPSDSESTLRGREGFKALTIEGASASTDAAATARYPYFREFAVVTMGEPQGAVKRFLEFISGPESEKLLAQSGVVVGRFK